MSEKYEPKVRKDDAKIDPKSGLKRRRHPLSSDTDRQTPEWWMIDPKDEMALAAALVAKEKHLETVQQAQRWGMALNLTLYLGTNAESMLASYGLPSVMNWTTAAELGGPVHNVVASCINTICAKVTTNEPKVTFITSGGDYHKRMRARGLTEFAAGLFDEIGIYGLDEVLTSDACLFGPAILKVYVDENGDEPKVTAKRVLRAAVKVDDAEAYYGNAKQFYEREIVTRDELLAQYPGKEDIIMSSPSHPESDFFFPGGEDTQVQLIEKIHGYRLPHKKGDAGRYTVATTSGILSDEPYYRMKSPYVILRWQKPKVGFWGDSLGSALRGYQLKINRLDRTIDETMRRMSLGRWMIAHGSKVSPMHLGNVIGSILRYQGQRPIIDNSNTVPAELIAERDAEIQKAHALVGVSQMDSSGMIPANLKSGEAIKVHEDINTQRFLPFERAYEQFHLDVAESAIDLIRDLADRGVDYKVLVKGKREIRELNWKTVAMKKEDYDMRVAATNYMAGDPAQQMDKATTLSQAGGLDLVETIDALDYPDVETATFPKTAPLRFVRWVADKMSEGEYIAPQEDTDFIHGIPLMKATKQQMQMDGAPNNITSLFDQWLEEANNIQKKAAVDAMQLQQEMQAQQMVLQQQTQALLPQPPAPSVAPGMPAQPMPPPQSQLIPQG